MPNPRPPIPQRRSSLDHTSQGQKKRLSLSNMPILSKLGRGKTNSPPISPTENATPILQSIVPARPSPLSKASTPIFERDPMEEALTDEPEQLEASSGPGVRRYSETTATHKGRNGSLHLSIPDNPPTSIKTPPRGAQSPIGFVRSATADLGILREVDENSDVKGPLRYVQSDHNTTKPSSCPKSVWLCSKPPLSPPGSPTALSHARRKSETRPLVVRATTTGRLGSEMDDEGRVLCLSNHCERVLKARASMSPAPSPTRHLSRSVSNQDQLQTKRQVIRSRTSDLFPVKHSDKEVRKQRSWRRPDDSRTWKELSA